MVIEVSDFKSYLKWRTAVMKNWRMNEALCTRHVGLVDRTCGRGLASDCQGQSETLWLHYLVDGSRRVVNVGLNFLQPNQPG